jgi:two-component system, OmpR family, response regulator CpxR
MGQHIPLLKFRSRSLRPCVLCVDDEVNALSIRRMVLEGDGFHVFTAANASDAIKIVESEAVDCVLTDYYLEDGSTGGELTRLLKQRRPYLPIAIYSGAVDLPEDSSYADAIIPKTGGATALIGAVRSLLAVKQKAA